MYNTLLGPLCSKATNIKIDVVSVNQNIEYKISRIQVTDYLEDRKKYPVFFRLLISNKEKFVIEFRFSDLKLSNVINLKTNLPLYPQAVLIASIAPLPTSIN